MNVVGQLKKRSVDGIDGLVVVIVQEEGGNEVLMQAFATEEAVQKTIATGKAHYFSTSRRKLWCKGESSGNVQEVVEVLVDCDADCIIYKVKQVGGACHKGYRSCFFRSIVDGQMQVNQERLFDPEEVYGKK